jgi:hypothetical protein
LQLDGTVTPEEEITGVSAVNAVGEVLVFCNAGYCDLAYFVIRGNRIAFFAEGAADEHFSEAFGRLTVDTAALRGDLVVCFPGNPDRYMRVYARYGL